MSLILNILVTVLSQRLMCILPEEGRSQEKLQSLVNNDKAKQNKKLGDMWAKDGILAQPLIDPSNTS